MAVVYTNENMSEELILLVWDTFFKSRGRGISFERHFPWAKTASNVWSIEAVSCGRVIGGLVVREQEIAYDIGIEVVGCIGLVCVHPDYRGKGIANQLFEKLICNSLIRKYAALTLWTNQHHIYQSKGFVVYDQSVYGTVNFINNENIFKQYELTSLPADLGLPPFAKSGNKYLTNTAEISVLWDDEGGIIVNWSGDDESIISLIKSVFPKSFRINSCVGCPILRILSIEKCDINVSKSNLQMWLQLNKAVNIRELEALGRFSVLNRI